MPNSSEESPAFSKSPNEDLKDMHVFCTFKIKIDSQNSDYGCVKDQLPYSNQDQDAKPQSGTSSILQILKCGLNPVWLNLTSRHLVRGVKGHFFAVWLYDYQHGCFLHLQNQDREPKFGTWLYQRPETIYISRPRWQTAIRNLQHSQKPKMRNERTWMFFPA